MEWILQNFELERLDFSTKYALIILNFITIIVLYLYKKFNIKKLQQKPNILIIIAHPDDESMYFQPTIANLKQNHYIHILCLTGDEKRSDQLSKAAKKLQITKFQIINHEKIVDGLNEKWDQEVVRTLIMKYIKQNSIKAIFTFDKNGISNHINHKSINSALQKNIVPTKLQNCIKMYELTSTNIIRKYISILDLPVSLLSPFVFLNMNVIKSYSVMSTYVSQFVYYRKLFIIFSRYSIINSYEEFKWIKIQ